MIITSWKGKRVVVCNCCMIHKGKDEKGWYHNGKVDYCPKCARLMGKIGTREQMERLQSLVNQP